MWLRPGGRRGMPVAGILTIEDTRTLAAETEAGHGGRRAPAGAPAARKTRPQSPGGANPSDTLTSDFWPPELGEDRSGLSPATWSLWHSFSTQAAPPHVDSLAGLLQGAWGLSPEPVGTRVPGRPGRPGSRCRRARCLPHRKSSDPLQPCVA